jgi:hypothetical protein
MPENNNSGGIWSGAAAAGLGMLGGVGQANRQYHRQKKLMNFQQKNQMALNRQGHDLQMDMWNKTNYGAQVKHMKDAGLNPALMYGGAGQGGSTGSQGGGSAAGGSATGERVMDLSNMLMGAEIALKNSQAKLNDKKTEETGQNIGNLRESEKYTRLQGDYLRIENANKQDVIDAELKRIGQQTANLKQEFDLKGEQWDDLVKEQTGRALEAMNNNRLIDAKVKLTNTEKQAINEKLDIAYSQLGLDSARVGMEIERVSYDKIRTAVTKEYAKLNLDQQKRENWVNNGTRILVEFIKGAFGMAIKVAPSTTIKR